MKAHLMYRDRDLDLEQYAPGSPAAEERYWMYRDRHGDEYFDQHLPWNAPALIQDLELETLFQAMAGEDPFLLRVAKKVVLSAVQSDPETIRRRQEILKDCLQHPSIVRELYAIAVDAIKSQREIYWGIFSKYPSAILDHSVKVLELFVDRLKKLRRIADEQASEFQSEGLTTLFAMLQRELDDSYFAVVENHLKTLKFNHGVVISADLGTGLKGGNYILRSPPNGNQNWLERIFKVDPFGPKEPTYTFYIADRDENGFRALSELKDRGINLVANALGQSTDHILSFFTMFQTELAFYIGCLNLYELLAQIGERTCFPEPAPTDKRRHSFVELYDVSLALTKRQKAVGNDGNVDAKDVVIITGANQGGKSTFLRSIGLAQLMMQAGMFVPAESFSANLCEGLFTHYKREEDVTMKSGKFDEEMSRMSEIADHLKPNSMVLFNESFAATNEREGSEIARQIVSALLEGQVKVFFVTHLYEFAHGIYARQMPDAYFLRAERQPDGTRTFKLKEGEPLQTSFGEDVYRKIFGDNVRDLP